MPLSGHIFEAIPLYTRAAMINDDVVKCPLCGGFTHIEQTDLREALRNPRLREQVEHYMAELLKFPGGGSRQRRRHPVGHRLPERCSQLEPVRAHVAAKPEGVDPARQPGTRSHDFHHLPRSGLEL